MAFTIPEERQQAALSQPFDVLENVVDYRFILSQVYNKTCML